jgi:hypothetical protein
VVTLYIIIYECEKVNMARKRKTIKFGDIVHSTGKIITMGDSLAITLPKKWTDEHNLKAGDTVSKVANSMLTVSPKPEPNKESDIK